MDKHMTNAFIIQITKKEVFKDEFLLMSVSET